MCVAAGMETHSGTQDTGYYYVLIIFNVCDFLEKACYYDEFSVVEQWRIYSQCYFFKDTFVLMNLALETTSDRLSVEAFQMKRSIAKTEASEKYVFNVFPLLRKDLFYCQTHSFYTANNKTGF